MNLQRMNIRCFGLVLHGAGILVTLVIIVSSVLAYAAIENKTKQLHVQQEAAQDLLASKSKVFDEHNDMKSEVSTIEARARQMRSSFPETPDETGLLATISQLAHQAGIEIHNFRAGLIQRVSTHNILEVSFRADGTYNAVCQFLVNLKHMPRCLHISQLNIDAPTTAGQSYTIDVQLQLGFALHPELCTTKLTP